MIDKERLERCALFPFPKEGQNVTTKQYHNKPLLYLLFTNTNYFAWSYKTFTQAKDEELHNEMRLLLDAIATIKPKWLCPQGNPKDYLALRDNKLVGQTLCCKDENCCCREPYKSPATTFIPYTLKHFLKYLDNKNTDRYIDFFKAGQGLTKTYSKDRYLKWLLSKASLEELDDGGYF